MEKEGNTRATRSQARNLAAPLLASLLFLVAPSPLAHGAGDGPGDSARSVWQWQRTELANRAEFPTALAYNARDGRIAVGDRSGVRLFRFDESARRVARVEGVNELHFASDQALWIASRDGLWRLAADGRLEDRSPGPGESARRIHRIRSADGLYALASDNGVFLSRDGRRWQPLGNGATSGRAQALALRRVSPDSVEVWFASDKELWRALLWRQADAVHVGSLELQRVPGRPMGARPVDLLADPPGAELAILYPREIALLRDEDDRWEIVHPELPPGASARRIIVAGGRAWLASDRGLLESDSLAGPWRRANSPAGGEPTELVVEAGGALLAIGPAGLLKGVRSALRASDNLEVAHGELGDAPPSDPETGEPEIGALQRAVLIHSGLRPARLRALRRGLARRGWLPRLSLSFGFERDRISIKDHDEAFVSGETRLLDDRERRSADELDAEFTLSWDLGDLAYNPEVVDLSREARQVIALRDDILDEVNQLYYERQRILLKLAALQRQDAEDSGAALLRNRADELAAGLDAWTGGWYSAQLRRHSAQPISRRPARDGRN